MSAAWWRPKNDVERAMAAALKRGDPTAYFRTVASADLYLPQVGDGDPADRSPVTLPLGGRTLVLVFTSVEGMTATVGDDADHHTRTSYAELRAGWPTPEWWLAVNPGLPIGAYLPVAAVERVARGELTVVEGQLVPTDPAAAAGGPAYSGALPVFDPTAVALLTAAESDMDEELQALFGSLVIVPTKWQLRAPDDLFAPDLPLRVTGLPDHPTIEVFTTREAVAAAHPDLPNVSLPFQLLLALLPDRVGLLVDPGGTGERELRDDRLALVMLSALESAPAADRARGFDPPGHLLAQVRGSPPPGG